MCSYSVASTLCVGFILPLLHAEQQTSLIHSVQQRNTFWIHQLMVFSFSSESITLMPSSLAATMADDNSYKDNGLVGRGSLSFTAKCLYNDALSHVWSSQFEHVNKLRVQKFQGSNFQGWGKICKNSKIYCPWKFPAIRYKLRPKISKL